MKVCLYRKIRTSKFWLQLCAEKVRASKNFETESHTQWIPCRWNSVQNSINSLVEKKIQKNNCVWFFKTANYLILIGCFHQKINIYVERSTSLVYIFLYRPASNFFHVVLFSDARKSNKSLLYFQNIKSDISFTSLNIRFPLMKIFKRIQKVPFSHIFCF